MQHSNNTGYCGGEIGKASGGGEAGIWYKHEGERYALLTVKYSIEIMGQFSLIYSLSSIAYFPRFYVFL